MENYSDIKFENLDYGAYILEFEDNYALSENVKYAGAEFNKLHVRQVRLPDGRGNIIYLLTNTFENSIKMINSNNFIIPPSYTRFFYPQVVNSQFMGRRIKINVSKKRNERNTFISKQTKLRSYASRTIQKRSMENIFFGTSDIFEAMLPIMKLYIPKRIYQEFYPQFMSIIKAYCPEKPTTSKNGSWDNRILLIDVDGFKFDQSANLTDNKTNPLFMIYLAFLRNRNLTSLNVDVDMMICSKNLFIKFNPSKTTKEDWPMFKRALFRIMNVNLDDYTNNLSDNDKSELSLSAKDNIVDNIIDDTVEVYGQMASASTKEVLANAVETQVKKNIIDKAVISKAVKNDQKEIAKTLVKKTPEKDLFTNSLINNKSEKLLNMFSQYEPLGQSTGTIIDDEETDDETFDMSGIEDLEDDVKDEVNEVLTSDEEIVNIVIDEIQDKTAPLKNIKTAPINSARDQKLREEQKKIAVKNETIEQVLERDSSNIPIESMDKSAVMHTSNENMKKIKFTNFDKTYIENLYTKDLLACFDMLKDKSSPFYITGIDIKDTSNTMNYQETWTVHLVDEVNKKHTIKVDIPKFQNNRFMLIDGTKWIILKQNFYNPLVKDTPDTVILTTNFNKVTIDRKATK